MTTANEYLYYDLIAQARESAERRGHSLRAWVSAGKLAAMTDCSRCGREVHVEAMPPANGIHIGGEAVALNCVDNVERA